MGPKKDLKKIIGYHSDEILYLPYEEITFELLEIACKDDIFLEVPNLNLLINDESTLETEMIYKQLILVKAYFNVLQYELLFNYKCDKKTRDCMVKDFIQEQSYKLKILMDNFYSDNYSQDLVQYIIGKNKCGNFAMFYLFERFDKEFGANKAKTVEEKVEYLKYLKKAFTTENEKVLKKLRPMNHRQVN